MYRICLLEPFSKKGPAATNIPEKNIFNEAQFPLYSLQLYKILSEVVTSLISHLNQNT